jgi:hypothetical protein
MSLFQARLASKRGKKSQSGETGTLRQNACVASNQGGLMSFIATVPVDQAEGDLSKVYGGLTEAFGMVPAVFQSMSLRPDLLQPLSLFVKRLMIEEHALPRMTKELLAAYVSKLNACAY